MKNPKIMKSNTKYVNDLMSDFNMSPETREQIVNVIPALLRELEYVSNTLDDYHWWRDVRYIHDETKVEWNARKVVYILTKMEREGEEGDEIRFPKSADVRIYIRGLYQTSCDATMDGDFIVDINIKWNWSSSKPRVETTMTTKLDCESVIYDEDKWDHVSTFEEPFPLSLLHIMGHIISEMQDYRRDYYIHTENVFDIPFTDIYLSDPAVMEKWGTSDKFIILRNRAMCAKCGEIIESYNLHDFKRCKCGTVYVDGGRVYFHQGSANKDEFISMNITVREDGDFEYIRKYLIWGTRGESGDEELHYVLMKDMSVSHIENVLKLDYISEFYRKMMEKELKYREEVKE